MFGFPKRKKGLAFLRLVVLQKDHRLARDLKRDLAVLLAADVVFRDAVVRAAGLAVIETEADPHAHGSAERFVEILFRDQAELQGLLRGFPHEGRVVEHVVDAGMERLRERVAVVAGVVVEIADERHRAAVADAVERAVLLLEDLLYFRVQDARQAVDLVVRGHDADRAALLDHAAERLQVELLAVSGRDGRVLEAAAVLGVVRVEVL